MVKAVFLDFYNTLVRFWPPLDEIQQASCNELGLNVSKEGIRKGYVRADEFMSEENSKRTLAVRSQAERDDFFAAYEQLILKEAGLEVSFQLARQVWQMAIQVPKDFALFDDVLPGLELLKKRNVATGVISNLRRDMTSLCEQLGLSPYLDFAVTSAEVGAEKPHAPVFLEALKRANVEPGEAVHVGDQYIADAQGARAVGITPVLMDREGWQSNISDCTRIASLPELDRLLENGL
jgi:HAD superfamily hydrolase (TIGR01549 family)